MVPARPGLSAKLPLQSILSMLPCLIRLHGCAALKLKSPMQGTFYGHQQDQDSHAACSYSENRAGTMNLTWTTGAAVSLAMNSDQFNGSKACGMCVMYRGGPLPTTSHSAGSALRVCHVSEWNGARSHARCHKGVQGS